MGELLNSITGVNRAAEGAQRAALERQALANKQFDFAKDFGADIQGRAVDLASASPQELSALEGSLNAQTQNLDKQAQLFAALDPAIMEASKQALGLLKGQEASTLSPLRKQRERQRQRLLDSLREQMGPGAETSSAGIQALANFDLDTSMQLENAQQSSLGQLFQMGQSGAAGRGALGQTAQGLLGVAQGYGNIAGRKSQALTNAVSATTPLLGQTMSGQLDSAGAKHTAETLKGQGQMQMVGSLLGAGLSGAAQSYFSARDTPGKSASIPWKLNG